MSESTEQAKIEVSAPEAESKDPQAYKLELIEKRLKMFQEQNTNFQAREAKLIADQKAKDEAHQEETKRTADELDQLRMTIINMNGRINELSYTLQVLKSEMKVAPIQISVKQ